MNLTIAHMVFVHERIVLWLDALDTSHVLIMVIISRIGLIFLLELLTPTLSPNIWTVYVFPITVNIPLSQIVKYKEL
jgi:hypothetical protein